MTFGKLLCEGRNMKEIKAEMLLLKQEDTPRPLLASSLWPRAQLYYMEPRSSETLY